MLALVSAVALLILGALLITYNWVALYVSLTQPDQFTSPFFFVGGALAAVGVYLLPHEASRYWWIPFIVDWGGIPGLIMGEWWNWRHKRRK
jgi:hypothetical protein